MFQEAPAPPWDGCSVDLKIVTLLILTSTPTLPGAMTGSLSPWTSGTSSGVRRGRWGSDGGIQSTSNWCLLNLCWCPVFLHCWQWIPRNPCHKSGRCQGGLPALHPDWGSLHCVGHGRGAGQLSDAGLPEQFTTQLLLFPVPVILLQIFQFY